MTDLGPARRLVVRDYLVYYFEEKQAFRRSKITPRDMGKNGRYADALAQIVAYIRGLPDDDPTLKALAECEAFNDPDAGFGFPTALDGSPSVTDSGAIHCRCEPDCAQWLMGWAQAAMSEAAEIKTRNDRQ
jgi:hypothetical protein